MVARIGIAHHAVRLVTAATTAFLLLSGTAVAQLALSGDMPVPGTGIPVPLAQTEKQCAAVRVKVRHRLMTPDRQPPKSPVQMRQQEPSRFSRCFKTAVIWG